MASHAECCCAVCKVVFAGLDVLVPLMTGDLLQFPKLCRSYFALLGHMLEVYPERLAALPGEPTRFCILCWLKSLRVDLLCVSRRPSTTCVERQILVPMRTLTNQRQHLSRV